VIQDVLDGTKTWWIETGDSLEVLKSMPDGCVQTCVTSPPYWGLRDYGVEGQLGLEPTPEEYVARMVEIFREVRRVLRDDGTCWLNLGDSYVTNGYWANAPSSQNESISRSYGRGARGPGITKAPGLKPKDLVGIPWRVAFALQADGWYLRSDIIWHKPSPMPESVTDRPTSAHEHIFLLSKSARYYYDAEAVKEESIDPESHTGRNKRNADKFVGQPFSETRAGFANVPEGKTYPTRNKRNVWTVATKPYPDAHFAVYPPKLIEPCILAGTSPQACEVCGAPWERVVERTKYEPPEGKRFVDESRGDKARKLSGAEYNRSVRVTGETWQPTCTCDNEGTGRSIVLDPFSGAGTTGLVALRHERAYIGIELNPKYTEMSIERIEADNPIFNRGFGRYAL